MATVTPPGSLIPPPLSLAPTHPPNFKSRYHHEARPMATVTPPVPAWKGPDTPGEDEDDDGDAADGGAQQQQQRQVCCVNYHAGWIVCVA